MPRILGVDIPGNKKLNVSLTYIYGIGATRADEICAKAQIDPAQPAHSLTEGDIANLTRVIQDGYRVEGELRRQVSQNVRRLMTIKCYRGIRHQRSLPCRGQRTRTNSRTKKGKKQTVGAIRDRGARRASRTE